MSPPWRVETVEDTAAALHAGSAALVGPVTNPAEAVERTVRVLRATDRAVVLGRAQPATDVDTARAAAAQVSVVRRASGGGAVLVDPGLVAWVDLVIPAGDPLWHGDVGRSFWWLGQVWVDALDAALAAADAGCGRAQVWRGGLVRTRWSAQVCFAGLGPGEVTLDGAKAVGLSQRRTGRGALFQCALALAWDPVPLLELLALGDDERALAATELGASAAGVGREVADRVVTALLECLP